MEEVGLKALEDALEITLAGIVKQITEGANRSREMESLLSDILFFAKGHKIYINHVKILLELEGWKFRHVEEAQDNIKFSKIKGTW